MTAGARRDRNVALTTKNRKYDFARECETWSIISFKQQMPFFSIPRGIYENLHLESLF